VSGRLRALEARFDPTLYTLWAAFFTLASARAFYGYMMKQTGGEWSAPLDDVFIHFDFARATAAGHPFEWVAGNGYSSGNTSLLYPFALAVGVLFGFRDVNLMAWAAIVAAVCVLGVLIAARPLFVTGPRDAWGRRLSFLLPPMLLGIGALDWSLWSGMEVSFFLGTWAIGLLSTRAVVRAPPCRLNERAWWLGAAGAVMVATRPEGASTIAVFGLAAAIARRKPSILLRAGSPALLLLALQSIANRALTGEWSANGAIVKLALYNPFLTGEEKLADYTFNLRYAIFRNLEYHFTDDMRLGVLFPALGLVAIAVPQTRGAALVLWGQILGWLLLVATNGQVRWQNERYTMPAVAWLMIVAALGVSGLVRRSGRPSVLLGTICGAVVVQGVGIALRPAGTIPEVRLPWLLALGGGALAAAALSVWPVRALAVCAALYVAHDHQLSKMRGQKWFFGRACRNIRDQHVTLGRWLAAHHRKRVLVGDAGAIIFASELPGLDIIGLGGFKRLPWARAGVQGLAASLELLEHVPPSDRPDVLAIFPSWWGVLPTWFSSGVLARFPIDGNVICGDFESVVYEADWHLLGSGASLRAMPAGDTRVVDSLDVADLMSEEEHGYSFPRPAGGWTDMKILADPSDPARDMFDGGRRIGAGRSERFVLRGLSPQVPMHLVLRSAPDQSARARVRVRGVDAGSVSFEPREGWVEEAVTLPAELVGGEMEVEITNDGPGEFVDYHAWATQ
jgi:hypothetical protein